MYNASTYIRKFNYDHNNDEVESNSMLPGGGGLSDKCTYMYAHLYILL